MGSSDKDLELGLENGVNVNAREEEEDYSKSPISYAKIKGGFADVSSCCGCVYEENLQAMLPSGNSSNKDGKGNNNRLVVKEKRKSLSNKKPPKPPRAPRAPSLDAADQKLIKEIAELARLKRARIERIKALNKMKDDAKGTSSNTTNNMLVTVFTIIFCIVVIFQGFSSGGRPTSSQGSPVPIEARAVEEGLIAVHFPRKLFANRLDSGSPYLVEPVAGLDAREKLKRSSESKHDFV